MRIIIFLILCSLVQVGVCQQNTDVELIEKAYKAQNPNEAFDLLHEVKNPESLADTSKNKYYLSYGVAYGQLGKVDSSNLFLNYCVENAKNSGDDYHLMKAYSSFGLLWKIQGDHEKSLESFQSAEKISEKYSNAKFGSVKSSILGNIGGIFYQLTDYASAKKYSLRALKMAKSYNDTSELAYGYLRLAIVAEAQDSLNQSLAYNKSASQFLENLGDYNTLTYVQNNLGKIYKGQGDHSKALLHHQKANAYAEILGDAETKANTALSIGESYFELSQLEEAKDFVLRGLQIAENSSFPIHSKNAHHLLFKIAEKQGDFRLALEEKKLSVAINDSLNAAEARERLAEVETKYETEKKEAEITRLSLENDLKGSRILAGGIGAGLAIILLIVFFTLRNKKQKAEKEAQGLQIEALKKRFIELSSNPAELAVELKYEELNEKLHTPLTEREFESLKLSVQGKTNTEIAEQLFITNSTVKFHLRNTYAKMGVVNRKEAFQYIAKTS